ncbi:MAG: hypothetical protein AUK35_10365 [Zetaproteobacteria bacterium CG2_30_46_52]|nr:MAG: hypothetical protein AUK35_10365 [Zetaproteobacteria bacterium CG2_30_46_52]
MKFFDKEQQKIAFVLFVVGIISAGVLGLVAQLTEAPIAQAQRDALNKNLVQVLPEHANDAYLDAFELSMDGQESVRFYPAKDKRGNIIAYAWQQIAPDGYSGTIRILMGVRTSGEVVAIRVIDHRETPGLGDGITLNQPWLDSFQATSLSNTKWAVKKDGGVFDQFTGATITPRSVVKAVRNGLIMFAERQDVLRKTYREKQRNDENKKASDGGQS